MSQANGGTAAPIGRGPTSDQGSHDPAIRIVASPFGAAIGNETFAGEGARQDYRGLFGALEWMRLNSASSAASRAMICCRRTPDSLSLIRRAGVSLRLGYDMCALSRLEVSWPSAGNRFGQAPRQWRREIPKRRKERRAQFEREA